MGTHVTAGCITGAFAGGAFGELALFRRITMYRDNNMGLVRV